MNITYLDSYCERLSMAGWAAEPLNALTNLAFLWAAYSTFRLLRHVAISWKRHLDIYALALIMGLIGVGSGLWHTVPSALTNMLDVIPITLFINLYLASLLKRAFRWRWAGIVQCFALLHALNYVANTYFPPDTLYGTLLYLPTWGVLAGIVGIAHLRHHPFARSLTHITLLWTLSLCVRTLDVPLCDTLPFGTHWLWHVLNAVVLYRLFCALMTGKSASY